MKFFLLTILIFFSNKVSAALDEVIISTEDKKCSIHYLTPRVRYNWTIKVDLENCKEGWVDGFSTVQLYSPKKELTETLSGFFKEGYWTDTFFAPGMIIERMSPEDKVQAISFLLGEDKEANITYIGQLRAIQPDARPYGPFMGCPDFRVLVVVPETSAFQNQAFQDKIMQQSLKYAYSYCSEPKIIAIFGALSAQAPDIVFQMQVDPLTKEKKIMTPFVKDVPKEILPEELRMENTDILVSVKTNDNTASVSYIPEKNNFLPTKKENKTIPKRVLGDMRILSQTEGNDVLGRTVVHIEKVLLDGTGITDLPEKVQLLYYPNLKTGWAVVTGTLNKDKIQVSNVQFCNQEWCLDVP